MSIVTQRQGIGYMHAGAEELERKLRYGDGILWQGDPRLDLAVGVLLAPRRMQHPKTGRWLNRGDVVFKRYEVWRHTEDGSEELLGHWLIEEFDRILFDIVQMRAGFEGKIPTAIERIDVKNAAIDKQKSDNFRNAYGAFAEHYFQLWHDRNNPRKTFRGLPGRNPEKQM